MFEACPDKIPRYLTTPGIARVVHEGGEYIKKTYRDGVIVWINQQDGERETELSTGRHYENPETKEIHFLESDEAQTLLPYSEEAEEL